MTAKRTNVRGYTQKRRGKTVRIRRHTHAVVGSRRRKNTGGLLQFRRGMRHLAGVRNSRGRFGKRAWYVTAAVSGGGLVEILLWLLVQGTGFILATVALVLSGIAIALNSAAGAGQKRRKPQARSRPRPRPTGSANHPAGRHRKPEDVRAEGEGLDALSDEMTKLARPAKRNQPRPGAGSRTRAGSKNQVRMSKAGRDGARQVSGDRANRRGQG